MKKIIINSTLFSLLLVSTSVVAQTKTEVKVNQPPSIKTTATKPLPRATKITDQSKATVSPNQATMNSNQPKNEGLKKVTEEKMKARPVEKTSINKDPK